MDDLVRVAAQDEAPGIPEGTKDEFQLHVGEVLRLVDDDEVPRRLDEAKVFMAEEVDIVPP